MKNIKANANQEVQHSCNSLKFLHGIEDVTGRTHLRPLKHTEAKSWKPFRPIAIKTQMKTDDPILLYPILPCLTFQIYTISINYCTRCISVFPHQMKMGIFFLYQQSPRLSHVPLSVIYDTRFKIMEDTQCQYQSQCWVFGGERCPVCPSIKNLTLAKESSQLSNQNSVLLLPIV